MTLPVGGMGKIPEALAYTVEQHGGEVQLNARVKNIRIRNGRVCGLQVDERGFIEADFVLSTVNAMATYQFLLEESDQPRQLVRKAKRTPLSMSAFCVQLGVSAPLDMTSHIHYFAPMMDELNQFFQPTQDKAEWGYCSVRT